MKRKNSTKKSETAAANAATVAEGKQISQTAAKEPSAPKMSIYEYEEKYVKRHNGKTVKSLLFLLVALVGVIFAWCFFSIVKGVWEFNKYAGYAAAAVAVVLFILLYIVPIVKIFCTDYFITAVNKSNAAHAKRHNKAARRSIATKIVDLNNSVAGVGWYDGEAAEKLAAGIKFNDDAVIKEQLTALYKGSVKRSAKDIIFKCSLKSGMYSALSQDSKIDTMLIAVVNLQMIKDIVFLYGFRPSEARLLKIFASVVRSALVAYGFGGMKIGNGIVRTMGDAVKGIPFLGSVISTLVDSSVQGLANATLTAVIGFRTIRYLNTEYKLQNILDGVDVGETEEEFEETCKELERELKNKKTKAV